MTQEKDTYKLPDGPKDLCFNNEEFSKTTFSVDEFLQNQRKNANLETMRDDLGIYLKVLRSAMIELINKDYADFVNLSSNLIGLDKAINKIQIPLGQLREEVWQVKSNLDDAIEEITFCLDKRDSLRKDRLSLNSVTYAQQSISTLSSLLSLPKLSVSSNDTGKEDLSEDANKRSEKVRIDSLGPDLVERIALELNQIHFCISQCQELIASNYLERLTVIESILFKNLDYLFLQSIKESDLGNLKRCLFIFASLGKTSSAEMLFQDKVVALQMHKIISEISLQANPEGLKGIYKQILNFVGTHMKDLLELTSHGEGDSLLCSFHFLVNSFWPEVEKRLELHMSSIFAPGNPDLFFQNFSETQAFLKQLEQECRFQSNVKKLHQHPQYQSFLHMWNLPVYFQIRFQEIGGAVESSLFNWPSKIKVEQGQYKLSPSNAVWSAIEECWSPKVYLSQIAHRFWKLTLQVIARYYTWIGEALNEKWTDATANGIGRLEFLVLLFSDVELLATSLPQITNLAEKCLGNVNESSSDQCKSSLNESADMLKSRLPAITERIVSEVSAASATSLRQVSDIPRLFRRTNRDMPTKPCSYISAVVAPLLEFHTKYSGHVKPEVINEWLTLICSSVTCQLYVCVSDVLTSVQKTEESLRRLQKMRERGNPAAAAGEGRGIKDDDKIRVQLVIDINSFCEEVKMLGVDCDKVERLNDLKTVVENAASMSKQ